MAVLEARFAPAAALRVEGDSAMVIVGEGGWKGEVTTATGAADDDDGDNDNDGDDDDNGGPAPALAAVAMAAAIAAPAPIADDSDAGVAVPPSAIVKQETGAAGDKKNATTYWDCYSDFFLRACGSNCLYCMKDPPPPPLLSPFYPNHHWLPRQDHASKTQLLQTQHVESRLKPTSWISKSMVKSLAEVGDWGETKRQRKGGVLCFVFQYYEY